MTTWGQQGEKEAVVNVLQNIPSGGLAVVVDSYDIWNMLDSIIGMELRQLVEARGQNGGFLVVRPDPGGRDQLRHYRTHPGGSDRVWLELRQPHIWQWRSSAAEAGQGYSEVCLQVQPRGGGRA